MPLLDLLDHIRCRLFHKEPSPPPHLDPMISTGYGGPDSPRWPHEFSFRGDQVTLDLPQFPRKPVQEWLMSKPTGRWGYVFEWGDLWGVGFEQQADADSYLRDWGR